jgi:hypothetical protein
MSLNRFKVAARGWVLPVQIWLTAPGVMSNWRAVSACDQFADWMRSQNSFLKGEFFFKKEIDLIV